MEQISYANAYQVLYLQLADGGRAEALLGDGAVRARIEPLPYLVGEEFPSVYFEFPLAGDPFLDVTLLYKELAPGTRIQSDAVAGTEPLLDWYAAARSEHSSISFGFELDTHMADLPRPALHFQPRRHLELVEPFCALAGEQHKGRLYLNRAQHMPNGWDLSYFGMFQGRPDSPLRVCGYLGPAEIHACASDPAHLESIFNEIGFTAYDEALLAQAAAILGVAPGGCDFQFDINADGTIGDTFALDIQFAIDQPASVRTSFEQGPIARLFGLFEQWGIADERWKLASDAAFARALPFERADGSKGNTAFVLMPEWVKARWRAGELQPAKFYCLGSVNSF